MDSVIFIGAGIIAVTQFVKSLVPNINGAYTIAVAVVVGVLVSVFDTQIGIVDVTLAQGILTALASVGVHTTASRIG